MSDSRATTRAALGVLLTAGVTSAQAVYDYPKATYDGQSPVVAISSAGTKRDAYAYGGDTLPTFLFNIHVFTIYQDAAGSYSEADSETTLDAIEAQIDATIIASQTSGAQSITYAGRSSVNNIILGGATYRHETIPVEIEVHH